MFLIAKGFSIDRYDTVAERLRDVLKHLKSAAFSEIKCRLGRLGNVKDHCCVFHEVLLPQW